MIDQLSIDLNAAATAASKPQQASASPSKPPKKLPPIAALVLNRLRFWLTETDKGGCEHDGGRWIYKSIAEMTRELVEQFCVKVSESTVARALALLTRFGLVERKKLKKHRFWHVYYYRLSALGEKYLSGFKKRARTKQQASNSRSVNAAKSLQETLARITHKTRAVGFSSQSQRKFSQKDPRIADFDPMWPIADRLV